MQYIEKNQWNFSHLYYACCLRLTCIEVCLGLDIRYRNRQTSLGNSLVLRLRARKRFALPLAISRQSRTEAAHGRSRWHNLTGLVSEKARLGTFGALVVSLRSHIVSHAAQLEAPSNKVGLNEVPPVWNKIRCGGKDDLRREGDLNVNVRVWLKLAIGEMGQSWRWSWGKEISRGKGKGTWRLVY